MQGIVLPVAMVPGTSPIHSLNPIPKLIWLVGVVVISFSTQNLYLLATIITIAAVLVVAAGVAKQVGRALMVLLPLMSSLIVLQSIAPAIPRPWTVLTNVGPLTVYAEGVDSGLLLLGRILSVVICAFLLIMTTHPSDLFSSLKRLHVPHTLNFMLAMTLQLIPILQREISVVMSAQKSRAMKSTGFGAVLPSFVPVFVGAIERVQQLSISLESRGFGASGTRTSYRHVSETWADWTIGLLGLVMTAVVVYLGLRGGIEQAFFPVSSSAAFALVAVSALLFLSFAVFTVTYMLRN